MIRYEYQWVSELSSNLIAQGKDGWRVVPGIYDEVSDPAQLLMEREVEKSGPDERDTENER